MNNPTNNEHPITPSPELFKQWFKQWEDDILNERDSVDHVLDRAWRNGFQAGADQELEACVSAILAHPGFENPELFVELLRAARRLKPPIPEPPSLKEQAFADLDSMQIEPCVINGVNLNASLQAKYQNIRRALEALPE